MSNWKWLLLVSGIVLITVGGRTTPAQSVAAGLIQGTIKSADGALMEGVVVSARASGKSFTTSVFTDRQGNYAFPSLTWAGTDCGRRPLASRQLDPNSP